MATTQRAESTGYGPFGVQVRKFGDPSRRRVFAPIDLGSSRADNPGPCLSARQGAEAIGAKTRRREGFPVFRTIRSVPFSSHTATQVPARKIKFHAAGTRLCAATLATTPLETQMSRFNIILSDWQAEAPEHATVTKRPPRASFTRFMVRATALHTTPQPCPNSHTLVRSAHPTPGSRP